jgi:hypothetical protein
MPEGKQANTRCTEIIMEDLLKFKTNDDIAYFSFMAGRAIGQNKEEDVMLFIYRAFEHFDAIEVLEKNEVYHPCYNVIDVCLSYLNKLGYDIGFADKEQRSQGEPRVVFIKDNEVFHVGTPDSAVPYNATIH